MSTKRMTASKLKTLHEQHQPNSFYFTKKAMKFFGDTMSNYYVPAGLVRIKKRDDEIVDCYALERRRPVKNGVSKTVYFDAQSFSLVSGQLVE